MALLPVYSDHFLPLTMLIYSRQHVTNSSLSLITLA